MVDDGTACEIGIFYALMQSDSTKGIVGLLTDLRSTLGHEGHGLNLFVHGCVEAGDTVCCSIDDVVATLAEPGGTRLPATVFPDRRSPSLRRSFRSTVLVRRRLVALPAVVAFPALVAASAVAA